MTSIPTTRPLHKPLLSGNMPFARAGLVLNAAVPGLLLLWDALHHTLGADPINYAIHMTGFLAVLFLLLSLAVTPLRLLTGQTWLVQFRRQLGLFSFYYAAAHLLTYFLFTRGGDIPSTLSEIAHRWYLLAGAAALLILTALAITSPAAMVKKLGGKRWKSLHRLAYLAAILACIHYFMQVKADTRNPLIAAGLLTL